MNKKYTQKEMIELWPQAAGELSGFANHLRRSNAGLTAAQLEMAIQMSNEHLENLKKKGPTVFVQNVPCPSPRTS